MKRAKQVVVLVVVAAVAVSGTLLVVPRRSCIDTDPRVHRVFEYCFGFKELMRGNVRRLRGTNAAMRDEAYKIWFGGRSFDNSPFDIELCSSKGTKEIWGGRDAQVDCREKPEDFACFADALEAEQHAIEAEWPEFP